MRSLSWNHLSMAMVLVMLSLPLMAGCSQTGAVGANATQPPVVAPTPLSPTSTLSSNNTPARQPVARLVAADSGTNIYLEVGQTFTVTLEGNPSTGYTWEISPVDKTVISQVGDPVWAPKSNLLGAPAMLTLTFRADANGDQPLVLIYHRPWEKDVPPVEVFDVTVVVQAAPQQTQTLQPTSTPDSRPTPTTVAYPAGGLKGWLTYTNADYGFSLHYPPDWKMQPGYGTMAGHAVLLKSDEVNAQLVVAFKRSNEDVQIGRTGVGGGELLPRGSVLLIDKEIERTVLVFDGKDMTVLYRCTGCMDRGGLQFDFGLDYLGSWTDPTALTPAVEAQADLIVASVKMK
jgi:inhibitor of cysteine peptidase